MTLSSGISLVNNYRTQFNTIITKDSYAGLVKQMRLKRDQENAGAGAKGSHGGALPCACAAVLAVQGVVYAMEGVCSNTPCAHGFMPCARGACAVVRCFS